MFHHDMPTTAELFKIFGTLAIVIVIAALMTYFMLIKSLIKINTVLYNRDESRAMVRLIYFPSFILGE